MTAAKRATPVMGPCRSDRYEWALGCSAQRGRTLGFRSAVTLSADSDEHLASRTPRVGHAAATDGEDSCHATTAHRDWGRDCKRGP